MGRPKDHPCAAPALSAIWLAGVLGWLFEDSGVTVAAAALPFLLPLVAVILSSVPRDGTPAGTGPREPAPRPFDRYRQVHRYR